MRTFELVLVVRPGVKDADSKKLLETVKGWLGTTAKVTKEEDWGQKALRYPIKKENAGHYHQWFIESEESLVKDFEQRILRNDSIIRHLLLRTK
ncbi:MAG: 30S ribosomal protein S6 [Patescibacteria group bacterium]